MKKTIFMAAGGTAGHIVPALAVARVFKGGNPDFQVIFITDKYENLKDFSVSRTLLEDKGYVVETLDCIGLPSRFSLKYLNFVLKLSRSFFAAFALIKKYRPSVIAGFGGYVSFPVLMGAGLRRIPSIIHEQNMIPGRANRILAHFVSQVALSFEETKRYLNIEEPDKIIFTGNPVCKQTDNLDSGEDHGFTRGIRSSTCPWFHATGRWRPEGASLDVPPASAPVLEPGKFTILVMGGSQGAHRINEVFLKTISGLDDSLRARLQVIHLTGARDFNEIKAGYGSLNITAYPYAFWKQMDRVYSVSDLVICRAGATCLSELSYYGCAAVLVPYPYAYSHQAENARYFTERGAALMLKDTELSPERLKEIIIDLMNNPDKRSSLSANIKKLSCPDADQRLAEAIRGLIQGS